MELNGIACVDTIEITKTAINLLESIYIPGIKYKRSGVIVSDITPMDFIQQDLFDTIKNRPARSELMRVVDFINQKYGLKTLHLCVEGENTQAWNIRSEHRTPNVLTDINDILTIKI